MAYVSLILLDDVENLGLAGDEVRVAPGYARNYLIPKKLAAKATPGTLRLIESRKAAIAARRAAWTCPEPKVKTGYLARYAKLVSSASEGAVLKA